MTSGVTTRYGPITTTELACSARPERNFERVRNMANWITATAIVALLLGGSWLVTVSSIPAAECKYYGSCTIAALITYGTPL